jgi:hypothetical protein
MMEMHNHHSICHSELAPKAFGAGEESLSLDRAGMDTLLADIQIHQLLQRASSLGSK